LSGRPIFYDTETTGISSKIDRVVEIAAYDPVRDKTFEQLINPQQPIPPGATAVHKITDDMVKDAPTFSDVIPSFVEFCEGDSVLIAHNNDNFDILFLKEEFGRCDAEMPSWRFFDTLKWARRYRRDLPRHPLQFLREIYGIEANNAHRALDDVIVLHKVFIAMCDDLSIDQAYELLNTKNEADDAPLLTMPFGKHQGKPLEDVPKSYIKWLAGDGAFDKPENAPLKAGLHKAGLL
jgi:DNA polymerase-3 subunit epsilon